MSSKFNNHDQIIRKYKFLTSLLFKIQKGSLNSKKTVIQIYHKDYIFFLNLLIKYNIISSYNFESIISENQLKKNIVIELNNNFSFKFQYFTVQTNVLTLAKAKRLMKFKDPRTVIFLHTNQQGLVSFLECENAIDSSIIFIIYKKY
jgi:hypothetical protein